MDSEEPTCIPSCSGGSGGECACLFSSAILTTTCARVSRIPAYRRVEGFMGLTSTVALACFQDLMIFATRHLVPETSVTRSSPSDLPPSNRWTYTIRSATVWTRTTVTVSSRPRRVEKTSEASLRSGAIARRALRSEVLELGPWSPRCK